jgi:hypothetical protein
MRYTLRAMLLLLPLFAASQTGNWTWVKGANTTNPTAVYGTQGIADPANTPQGLYEAAEWTDLQGNFWLFGGVTVVNGNNVGNNNLWKFNPLTNQWTWVKGPGTLGDPGSYGTQGVASITNNPPARLYCSTSWTDLNGDFWFYGGYNNAFYADLWKYNIASNMWTWMKGPSTGFAVYGTQGVPAAGNHPGGRAETSAAWVDANNNLWMFGGIGWGGDCLNDLWRYNIATNQWTWMKGSSSFNDNGSYGVKGVPAANNRPSARHVYSSWKDDSGNFWFFGGKDKTTWHFNDMWRYEPATNQWTWMSGTGVANNDALLDSLCSPSTANYPSSRFENRSRWKDSQGNFWFYGGGITPSFTSAYSDLWCFNPTTLEWTMSKGDTASFIPIVYGTLGTGDPTNNPGGRNGSLSWLSTTGELYLFGGTANGWLNFRNDIWKFVIDTCCMDAQHCATACAPFSVTLTASQNIFCATDSARVCAPAGFTSYLWNTGATTDCITANLAGNYYITVTDNTGCTALSNPLSLNVYPQPPVTITLNGDTLTAYNAVTYQWYLNNNEINNATDSVFVVTVNGFYSVAITDTNGCTAFSNNTFVNLTGIEDLTNAALLIFPNPARNAFTISIPENLIGETLTITDVTGKLMAAVSLVTRPSSLTLSTESWSAGIYFVRAGNTVKRLVVE